MVNEHRGQVPPAPDSEHQKGDGRVTATSIVLAYLAIGTGMAMSRIVEQMQSKEKHCDELEEQTGSRPSSPEFAVLAVLGSLPDILLWPTAVVHWIRHGSND